ncbi:unnamed protein product [Gordionus sp. m RMFG-2023]
MAEIGKLRVLPFVANSGGLPANETTFVKMLKEFGYSTALIGKWHLGVNCRVYNDNCHHPMTHGFDHFYGLPLTNLKDFGNDGASVFMSNNPRIKTGLTSAIFTLTLSAIFISRYYTTKRPIFTCLASLLFTAVPLTLFYVFITNIKLLNSVLMLNTRVVEQPISFDDNLSQRLLDRGVNFLRKTSRFVNSSYSLGPERPFLLFFSFLQVHTVLHTAPRFSGASQHGRYGDNIHEMDWMVGHLLDALETFGLASNTFVYFTSDQGGHVEEKGLDGQREGGFNGKFKGGKGQGGMEGGIRVPGIIRYPPLKNNTNPEISIPTSLMDLWPTIVNLAKPSVLDMNEEDDIEINKTDFPMVDGKDLWPLLTSKSSTHHHQFLFHYCGTEIHAVRYMPESENRIWKIYYITPRWIEGTQGCHYICFCYGSRNIIKHNPPLLFELISDPFEDTCLTPHSSHHFLSPSSSSRRVNNKDKENERKTLSLEYYEVLGKVERAIKDHKKSIVPVPSQFSAKNTIWKPWLQPCCNPPWCHCKQ